VTYLVALLVSFVLLAGFVLLTQYETRRGARYFAPRRDAFDTQVERIEFIVEHVDLGAFLRDELRNASNRAGHAIANFSLQAVRAAERLLTRVVRYLRVRHEVTAAPRESTREFVKTLSDFKENLKAPEVPDIQ
jgi:hypothetical protein